MKTATIIWDFDGTLLPLAPYDSEQSLLMAKLYDGNEKIALLIRLLARVLIFADNNQCLRKTFKRFYVWFIRGTPVASIDPVCARLAEQIGEKDRQAILQLKAAGHHMIVLSCGTIDLCERVLQVAGLRDCFASLEGNRFETKKGQIAGMTFHMPNPEDKLRFVQQNRIGSATSIAVGDGYTDIPLLDWAHISFMIDRSGKKKKRYRHKNYRFISSIAEILNTL